MFSLAALRYRNVLTSQGGPVERITTGMLSVCERRLFQANATLRPNLREKRAVTIYGDCDGTGIHRSPGIAWQKAVSTALESWAFHSTSRASRAAEFGFDVDPSSNGLSAFPGLLAIQARRKAMLEAVERFCLIAWWEGRTTGQLLETDWPGISALAIDGPFGGVTVIAFARTEWGGYAYGHAAEESLGAACEGAVIALARHDHMLRAFRLTSASGLGTAPATVFERRALFFATQEGYDLFSQRLHRSPSGPPPKPVVICDREIPGPWTDYATVWRFALRSPSDGFLNGGPRYFFW